MCAIRWTRRLAPANEHHDPISSAAPRRLLAALAQIKIVHNRELEPCAECVEIAFRVRRCSACSRRPASLLALRPARDNRILGWRLHTISNTAGMKCRSCMENVVVLLGARIEQPCADQPILIHFSATSSRVTTDDPISTPNHGSPVITVPGDPMAQ